MMKDIPDNCVLYVKDEYGGVVPKLFDPTITDNDYSDKHQLLLQYMIESHMIKKKDLIKLHDNLFNGVESLNETLTKITSKIDPFKMDIKTVRCDITGYEYYVLIHTTGDPFFPRCSIFTKNQLEFLKQMFTGILLSEEGQIGKIQSLNSCLTLSKTDAADTIDQFIKEKLLIETTSGALSLSPLAVVEFEPFFKSTFENNLSNCELCRRLVFVGKMCNGCNQKFHFHCTSQWINNKRYDCPNCHQQWED